MRAKKQSQESSLKMNSMFLLNAVFLHLIFLQGL